MRTAIRALHPAPRRKVWGAIDALRADPASGKALARELAGLWRTRVGRLRLVYRFDDEKVEVVWIDRREIVYEEVSRRRGPAPTA